jgi:glyoxylase-like metal-dependent hydrolase (beta-lactamase superfamily II)
VKHLSRLAAVVSCVVAATSAARGEPAGAQTTRWCDLLPRPVYRTLPRVAVSDAWFEVYRVADGVFAIYEPFQFQEVISYLILGSSEALLFDTGMGIGRISAVVRQLTPLPVSVLNSHTHFDHVGGNAEFERILAMDTAYTRANARGFAPKVVAGEVAPAALCRGLPPGFDAARYRSRPFKPTRYLRDGQRIELGGRLLEVLHVPGHTPDAVALFDPGAGLLWTGDSFYEGPIWLFAPESDLSAYATSVDRLASVVPRLAKLLPAHNVAVSDPALLLRLQAAVAALRSGQVEGNEGKGGQLAFAFDGFSIVTSRGVLAGKKSPPNRGGSGLP